MPLATSIVVRLLATVLVIVAIAGQLAHLDALSGATLGLADTLTHNPRPSFLTLVAADAVVSTISGILALALLFRGDSSRGARGLGSALAAWSYLLAYSGVIVLLRPDPGVMRTVFEAHFPFVELIGLAGLIEFTTIFPRRLTGEDLTPPDSLPIGLRTLQHIRVRLLASGAPWVGAIIAVALLFSVNAVSGDPTADAALNPFMDLVRFFAVAVVVLNVRRSWALSTPSARGQMWWVVVGFSLLTAALALLIGGNILLAATHWQDTAIAWRPILLDLGLIGFVWGAAMAVFYSGALESAKVARTIFAVTVLATVALFLATGLEVLFSSALIGRISLPPGIGTAVTVIVAASTYGHSMPLIEKIMSVIAGVGAERTSTQ